MSYFDFNFVTDPPNDETVDEIVQLNENWTDLATKIDYWNRNPAHSAIVSPPVGTEALYSTSDRVAVYDGSAWNLSLNDQASWGAWTALPLRSPVVERSGWTPRYRTNPWTREIEFAGGVQADGAASAWSIGTTVEITTDTALSSSFAPQPGNSTFMPLATSQVTGAGQFAAAVAFVTLGSSPARTSISIRYQGDAGGGNFVMLDGLRWWY